MPTIQHSEAPERDGVSGFIPQSVLALYPEDQPRAARAYSIMRRAIIEMHLPPGSMIDERRICSELGISRTPLREALLKLQVESLVRIVPASGTYVSKIELETVFEGHLIRRALELETIRLAASRMSSSAERDIDFNLYRQRRAVEEQDHGRMYELDEEFHEILTEIGTSKRVWRVIHAAKAQLDRVRRLAFPLDSHLETILGEHETIVLGLKLREQDQAAEAMDVHLSRVFEAVKELIKQKRQLFTEDAEATFRDISARFDHL